MANSTLKQIAAELGISISTASRAINGKSVVNEETRQRVLELADKYAYSPNEIARSLQKCSTQTIAVVLPDISETFFGTIVKEIDHVVSQEGYLLILADTHERADKESKYLDMLYTRQVDALVLATVDLDGRSVRRFFAGNKPVVFIDNVPRLDKLTAITIDNRKASVMAVEHLVSHGHRRIATVIGSKEETTGSERLAGYREALERHGLTQDDRLIVYGDYKRESGYTAMKQLLSQREAVSFTAVYITSEKMTYGAMQAIHESGLRIPEDISVVGFDIHPPQEVKQQKITSIRQPEEAIGRLVGEQLLKYLEMPSWRKQEHILLEPLLEEGETVTTI